MSFKYVEAKTVATGYDEEMELEPEHLLRVCERCGREVRMKIKDDE